MGSFSTSVHIIYETIHRTETFHSEQVIILTIRYLQGRRSERLRPAQWKSRLTCSGSCGDKSTAQSDSLARVERTYIIE
jgi:hypothetical protein